MRRLQEADKSRFIKPIWKKIEASDGFKRCIQTISICGLHPVPEEKEIINFVNSGAADKYKIDWNQYKLQYDDTEIQKLSDNAVQLIDAYLTWQVEKQAKEEKKANIQNLKKEFSNKDMYKVIDEVGSWIFVCPLCYEAAVFMDSYKCGGAGARWCIGYEKDNHYWNTYTGAQHKFFILAINTDLWGDDNYLKYMLEIGANSGKFYRAWKQNDDPNDTIDSIDDFNTRILKDAVNIRDIITVAAYEVGSTPMTKPLEFLGTNMLEGGAEWTAAGDEIYLVPDEDDSIFLEDIYLGCKNKEIIQKFIIMGNATPDSFTNDEYKVDSESLDLHKLIIGSSGNDRKPVVTLPVVEFRNFTDVRIGRCYVDCDKIKHGKAITSIPKVTIDKLEVYDSQMFAGKTSMSKQYYINNEHSMIEYFGTPPSIRNLRMLPFGAWEPDRTMFAGKCLDDSFYLNANRDCIANISPGDRVTVDMYQCGRNLESFDLGKFFSAYVKLFSETEIEETYIRVMNARNVQEFIIPFELHNHNIIVEFVNSTVKHFEFVNDFDKVNICGNYSIKE